MLFIRIFITMSRLVTKADIIYIYIYFSVPNLTSSKTITNKILNSIINISHIYLSQEHIHTYRNLENIKYKAENTGLTLKINSVKDLCNFFFTEMEQCS